MYTEVKNGGFNLLLFTLLMMASINISSFFGLTALYIYIEFYIIILLILMRSVVSRNYKFEIDTGLVTISIVLLLVLILNMLRAGTPGILTSGNFIFNLFVIPIIAHMIGRNFHLLESLKTLRLFFYIFTFISLVLFVFNYSGESDFRGTLATGSVFGALMSLYALIFAANYHEYKQQHDLVLMSFAMLLLLLSEHRAGLLAIFVSLWVLFGAASHKGFIALGLRVLIFGSLLSLFVYFIIWMFPEILEKFFIGSEISLSNLRLSGRGNVWIMLYHEWTSDILTFLFGGGLSYSTHLIGVNFPEIIEFISVPHNEWLRLGLDIGIVGIVLYLLFLKRLLMFSFTPINTIKFAFVSHMFIEMFFSNVIYWSGSYVFVLILVGSMKRRFINQV